MFGGRPDEAGFTLIEMLVALSILSIAGLALLRLGGVTAINSSILEEQAFAQIVARNLAVEALSDPIPSPFGQVAGRVANAGRHWHWTRRTMRSPESRIQQIEVRVSSDRATASLTVFRRSAG